MTARAKQLAGIVLLLVAAISLWYLIGSDWHDSTVSTLTDLAIKAFRAILGAAE